MSSASLGLRFGLEVAALIGLYALGLELFDSHVAAAVAVFVGVAAWGIFNVPDDPSRSGKAPIVVAGWVRLFIELDVLILGVVGLAVRWSVGLAVLLLALIIFHYASTRRRLAWLVAQKAA